MTTPTWSGGGGAPPPKGPPGFDPRLIVGAVVVVVVAGLAFVIATGGGGSDPTPPTPSDPTVTMPTPTPGPGQTTTSSAPSEVASGLPEPYGQLKIAPVTGCTYSCLPSLSFTVATTDGLRQVTRPMNGDLRVRVTMTNPTPFEAAITEVTHSNGSQFPRQNAKPEGGVPLCPDIGDRPIKLAARTNTVCDMAFHYVADYTTALRMGINYTYLTADDEGGYDEQSGYFSSNDLAEIVVDPVDG